MNGRALTFNVALAVAMLVGAFALKTAEHRGWVDPETATRAVQTAIGLALAVYGNTIPKSLGPWRGEAAGRRRQAAIRVGGWAFTAAGLVYTALWAFTPASVADDASMLVVGAATALTAAYSLWCAVGARTSQGRAT